MSRTSQWLTCVFVAISWGYAAAAQSVCEGAVVFQCATEAAELREQITVCTKDQSYSLTRHALSTGEMYSDTPLIADANTTWFLWSEEDQVQLEIGFWSTDLAEPVTLHAQLPWNDANETIADTGEYAMWLQSPHWRAEVDQTLCAPDTIYADTDALWPAQEMRGPIGAFFSKDAIIPRIETAGRARVFSTKGGREGVPVYAAARPSAATPVWWMLQPGETVDLLDRVGDFVAVALPTNGMSDCTLRPERLGQPYVGPCATGWVDAALLERVQ